MEQLIGRKQYLDIAKGIGIILVVLGHCPQVYNPLKQWIYAFHMPLFFIISGMVYNKTSHASKGYFNKTFVADKFRRLIIPCFVWGIIYMIINAVMHKEFSLKKIAYLMYGSQAGFNNAGSLTSLWFLTCMFLAVCAFEIIQMKIGRSEIKNLWLLIVCSILCAAVGLFIPHINGGYPWCIDVMFLALAFMIWGFLSKDYVDKVKNGAACIIALISVIILAFSYRVNLQFIDINNVDMASRHFGNPLLYIIGAIAGSIAVLMVSKLITSSLFAKGLTYLGQCTIPIFILHKPIVQLLNKIGAMFELPAILIVVISIVVSAAISLMIYEFIKRYLPFVFGEKRKSSL